MLVSVSVCRQGENAGWAAAATAGCHNTATTSLLPENTIGRGSSVEPFRRMSVKKAARTGPLACVSMPRAMNGSSRFITAASRNGIGTAIPLAKCRIATSSAGSGRSWR